MTTDSPLSPEQPGSDGGKSGFFGELQRHPVYKVGGLYAVIGWALVQASDIALEAFEAPHWVLQSILIAVVSGFPLALLLARLFHPTVGAVQEQPARRVWILQAVAPTALLLTLGVSVFVARRWVMNERPARAVQALSPASKAIAVLPLSYTGPTENASFAEGMHEDLLTRLASVSTLHVLQRELVQPLANTQKDSLQLGKELGAGYVLWSSLRREGDALRLNSRLVDAQTGQHLWAKTYDRKLTDVFRLQAELSGEIASALQGALSPAERAQLERPVSSSVDAYEAFTRGRFGATGPERERWLQQAVELDPKFARAWAALAEERARAYQLNAVRRPEQLQRAREALERALSLAPEDFQVRRQAAWFYGQAHRDWQRAYEELARIAREQPNSSEVAYSLARAATRMGKPEVALQPLREAWRLEPASTLAPEWLARTYRGLRRFAEARRVYDELSRKGQLRFSIALEQVLLEFRTSRDAAALEAFVHRLPPQLTPLQLARLRDATWEVGDLPAFLERARLEPADGDDAPLQHTFLAIAQRKAGHGSASEERFAQTQLELRQRVATEPENATLWAVLGLSLAAGGGQQAEALAAAQRATALMPLTSDVVDAAHVRAAYACTLAWLGNHSEAVSELKRLLGGYYEESWGFYIPIYVEHLRRGLEWEPLRGVPAFEALLADPASSKPL